MNNDKSSPLFSIITVCRNASGSIGRTLNSIAGQTFDDYEFIVVDGASTDATLSMVESSARRPDILISEPDDGIYDAMNKGRDKASGEYLIFMNAGDSFHADDTLATLVDAIMKNDKPGIVYGQTWIVDADGRQLGPRHLTAPRHLTLKSFADGMVVCHQAFIANRKVTSMFDTRYRLSADYDWCIRCLQRSKHNVYVDRIIADYCFDGASTRNRRRSLMERFRIMAYYYGTLPTLWRHIKFLPRRLKRRHEEKRFNTTNH